MTVEFNKGYICCGCMERVDSSKARAVYKNSCICNDCYNKFIFSNKSFVFRGTKETEFVMAALEYEGLYRDIFIKFKFGGQYAIGVLIGMILEEYFRDIEIINGFDCIVPVPLSQKRLRERGYNQTEILAEFVSRAFDIPINKALIKTKHTVAQSTLMGRSRIDNIKNAFAVESEHDLKGKRVLLFDDIITTGSTANECARALKTADVKSVAVLCGARVDIKEENQRIY